MQHNLVRLVYVHPPIAWVALYLAFGVAAVSSILWLWPRTRSRFWDRLAVSAVEVGIVFTALTLITGSIWGRPTWGLWWTWDARLTSTALLLVLLLGYMAVRRVPADPDSRARRSAVVALVTAVDVPIVHFSVDWWHTLHQGATVLNANLSPTIHGSMAWTLLLGFVAFTLLFAWMLAIRYRVELLSEHLADSELDMALQERWAEGGEGARRGAGRGAQHGPGPDRSPGLRDSHALHRRRLRHRFRRARRLRGDLVAPPPTPRTGGVAPLGTAPAVTEPIVLDTAAASGAGVTIDGPTGSSDATSDGADLSPAKPGAGYPRRRRARPWRLWVVGAILVGAFAFLLVEGLGSSLNYFETVDQALAHKTMLGTQTFRLEGLVVPGTVHRIPGGVQFVAAGTATHRVDVVNHGNPPQLFQPDIPVVVVGHFSGNTFISDQLIVDHTANYTQAHPNRVRAPNGTTR